MRQVPCGRCGACKTTRRNEWTFRIKQEYKGATNALFCTFTYRDENIPKKDNKLTLRKKDYQDFMKRLRKHQANRTKIKIRYYCVGEYGTRTNRPHYHALLFNVHSDTIQEMDSIWSHGHTKIGVVSDASIHYVTKYHVNRQYNPDNPEQEFTTMSLKPAIGQRYIDKAAEWHRQNQYTHVINNGYKANMPRYFKDKIFNTDLEKWNIQINQAQQRNKLQAETEQLIKDLGIDDPSRHIWLNAIINAKNIRNKSDNDLF